jgi:hypothetical protein
MQVSGKGNWKALRYGGTIEFPSAREAFERTHSVQPTSQSMPVVAPFSQCIPEEGPALRTLNCVDGGAPRPTLTAGQVCMGNAPPPG